MRTAPIRRPKRRRNLREKFEWPIRLSLFGSGLVIGSLLAGPAFPTGSATKMINPAAVASLKSLATVTNVVAVRDEQGTAGFDPVKPAVDAVRTERVGTPPRPAVQSDASRYQGTLIVTSTPRGASVFVNGELKGETPLELHRQPAGSRALRLDLEGYDRWSRAINVVANDSTIVSARLSHVD